MNSKVARGVEEGQELAPRTDTTLARLLAVQSLQEGTRFLHNDRQVAHVCPECMRSCQHPLYCA